MKSVLISTRPKWCEKIVNGKKTIEVRKTAPSEVPFKAYIYATKPKKFYNGAMRTSDELLWLANGKVEMGDGFKFWADGDEYQCLNGRIIGEFVCDKVDKYEPRVILCAYYEVNGAYVKENLRYNSGTCLSYEDMVNYSNGNTLYGWHISDLKIYDKPRALSEFRKSGFMTEENWLFNLYPNTHCHYEAWAKKFEITRPPQSWCYVEGLRK